MIKKSTLNELSRTQLIKIAAEISIKGRHRMRKSALLNAILTLITFDATEATNEQIEATRQEISRLHDRIIEATWADGQHKEHFALVSELITRTMADIRHEIENRIYVDNWTTQISYTRTAIGWFNVLINGDCFNMPGTDFERITGLKADVALGCIEVDRKQAAELKKASKYCKKGGCVQWISAY